MWEANGQERQVALYVRTLAEAEKPKASAQLRLLVKQQEEILGISLTGLQRNRWIIAGAAPGQPQRPTVIAGGSTKERLRGS